MNNNERLVQVSPEFIEDALREHFENVKDKRAQAIHEEKAEEFIEMVAECGGNLHSASYVIDNWLINGERGTYADVWKYQLNNKEELDEENKESLDAIEERLSDNGYFYDRDLLEYCSM